MKCSLHDCSVYIINPKNLLLMGYKRKFSVTLTSSVLNLEAELVAYKRTPETYMMSRKEIPSVSYEVDVENCLPQLNLSPGNVSEEAMHKHHLSPGRDGRMYLCCTPLPDKALVPIIKLWLAHQALCVEFGLDIVQLEEFYKKAVENKIIQECDDVTDFVLKVCNAKLEVLELNED